MRQLLTELKNQYEIMDASGETPIHYMQIPLAQRIRIFNDLLQKVVVCVDKPCNEQHFMELVACSMDYLNKNFHDFQWPCHASHFHINFSHYLGCPMTTLNEIAENLSNIIKSNFVS